MFILKKKYTIKVPLNVSVYLSKQEKTILIKGPLGFRYLKKTKNFLFVPSRHIICIEGIKQFAKTIKNYQTSSENFILNLKKFILEVSLTLTKKLKFLGLGYRFFLIDKTLNLLRLNLGYSHNIYFRSPENISLNFNKNTLLYLKSCHYNFLSTIASSIRSYRKPEPYKGKGILYLNEIIKLKKIKKV